MGHNHHLYNALVAFSTAEKEESMSHNCEGHLVLFISLHNKMAGKTMCVIARSRARYSPSTKRIPCQCTGATPGTKSGLAVLAWSGKTTSPKIVYYTAPVKRKFRLKC
jgi:hypothetical protein